MKKLRENVSFAHPAVRPPVPLTMSSALLEALTTATSQSTTDGWGRPSTTSPCWYCSLPTGFNAPLPPPGRPPPLSPLRRLLPLPPAVMLSSWLLPSLSSDPPSSSSGVDARLASGGANLARLPLPPPLLLSPLLVEQPSSFPLPRLSAGSSECSGIALGASDVSC